MDQFSSFKDSDGKLHVSIEYVRWLKEEMDKIHNANPEDVIIYENNKVMQVDPYLVAAWKYSGMGSFYYLLEEYWKGNANEVPSDSQ